LMYRESTAEKGRWAIALGHLRQLIERIMRLVRWRPHINFLRGLRLT
jgi:hypothetical protein